MSSDKRIPILLYHRLGRPPRGARIPGQYVSPGLFRRHLAHLRRRGYEGVSAEAAAKGPAGLPARPVVITFDDGYGCLYEQALPILQEQGFGATVFMVAGGIDGANYWETARGDVEEPMLRPAEIAEMQAKGITFGSHTLNHPHLTALPSAEVRRELAESRQRLADLLGCPCSTLAYPYGDWDLRIRDLAAEAGYEAAFTTVRAVARSDDDPLALPRLNIRRYNIAPRFAFRLWRAMRAAR